MLRKLRNLLEVSERIYPFSNNIGCNALLQSRKPELKMTSDKLRIYDPNFI